MAALLSEVSIKHAVILAEVGSVYLFGRVGRDCRVEPKRRNELPATAALAHVLLELLGFSVAPFPFERLHCEGEVKERRIC